MTEGIITLGIGAGLGALIMVNKNYFVQRGLKSKKFSLGIYIVAVSLAMLAFGLVIKQPW